MLTMESNSELVAALTMAGVRLQPATCNPGARELGYGRCHSSGSEIFRTSWSFRVCYGLKEHESWRGLDDGAMLANPAVRIPSPHAGPLGLFGFALTTAMLQGIVSDLVAAPGASMVWGEEIGTCPQNRRPSLALLLTAVICLVPPRFGSLLWRIGTVCSWRA